MTALEVLALLLSVVGVGVGVAAIAYAKRLYYNTTDQLDHVSQQVHHVEKGTSDALKHVQLTLERLDRLVSNFQELRSEASALAETSRVIVENVGKASAEVDELATGLQLLLEAHSWERSSHTLEDFLRKVLRSAQPPDYWVTIGRLRGAVNATRFQTSRIATVLRTLEDRGDVELRGPPDSGQSKVRLRGAS